MTIEMIEEKEMYGEVSGVTREERLQRAAEFLDNVLLPAIEKGEKISEKQFNRLVSQFKENHPGPGTDFEIGHIWGIVYKRALVNKCLARKKPQNIPTYAVALEKALDLLTELT